MGLKKSWIREVLTPRILFVRIDYRSPRNEKRHRPNCFVLVCVVHAVCEFRGISFVCHSESPVGSCFDCFVAG